MHINRRPESVGVLNILLHLDQIYSLRNKNVPGGLTCSKNGPTRTGHIQVDRHQPSDEFPERHQNTAPIGSFVVGHHILLAGACVSIWQIGEVNFCQFWLCPLPCGSKIDLSY